MRISDVGIERTALGFKLSGAARWDDGVVDHLYFEYRGVQREDVVVAGEAFLLAMLTPAMAVGEDITCDVPVSERVLAGMPRTIEQMGAWGRGWHEIRVDAPPVHRSDLEPREIGSLFSGGVDSSFTAVRPRDEPITTLLTITGLDVRFEKRSALNEILSRLSAAAAQLGKRHVIVDTNVYEVGHKYLFRAEHHGAVLSAVVLTLGGLLRRCYIPTSSPGLEPRPWGTHTVAFPEWSTESTELLNDGGQTHRRDKVMEIVGSDAVLTHLRVCLRDPDRYNCGRCDKCVLTAARLQAAGAIDRCATLGRVGPAEARRLRVVHGWLSECRDVRDDTSEPALRRGLTFALWKGRLIHAARPVVDVVRRRRLGRRIQDHERAYT